MNDRLYDIDSFYNFFKNKNFETSRRFSGNEYSPEILKHFLDIIGNPHLNYKTIHVAGTTGKGSVATYLARSLCKFKTGLFVSPHLESIYERISINEANISAADFSNIWNSLCQIKEINNLSYFDALTAIAAVYFSKSQVNWAVFETGLGGRLDSTNNIVPEFSVITEIGLDHINILGKNIYEIAAEKAGIIKKGVPVYTNVHNKEALKVITDLAIKLNSKLHNFPGGESNNYQNENLEFVKWIYQDYFKSIPPEINISLKGRLEKLSEHPDIFFDSAHNPISIYKLVTWINTSKETTWNIYFNMMKERNIQEVAEIFIHRCTKKIKLYLFPVTDEQYYTSADLVKNSNIHNISISEMKILLNKNSVNHMVTGSMRLYEKIKNILTD